MKEGIGLELCAQEKNSFYQLVTEDGKLTDQELWLGLSSEKKIEFYKWMKLIRLFDRRSVLLQRQGRIGTYAPLEGQEAAQVGSALVLDKDDWIFPSYREHGVGMIAGMPISQIFLYWMGRVEGCKPPCGVRLLPPYVPIATQIPHAVGAAWATKLRKESSVAVAYFGDGATSEGDFHEACNFAGVLQLPVVLFCQNNGYAISVPFSKQSASKTIAQRSKAYSFEGIQVDGNDVLAVYKVMKDAVQKARMGGGPTLIEAITYRAGSHTTADNAQRYRSEAEVNAWEQKDPLKRYKKLLCNEGLWDEIQEHEWEADCKQRVTEGIEKAEGTPPVPGTHLFEHVYKELPQCLEKQKNELAREG